MPYKRTNIEIFSVDPTWDYFQVHLLLEQIREILNIIEGEIEKQDARHLQADKTISEQAQLAIDKLQELTHGR